jgi:glycosyltransferase involved in cell wall biosynthesis
MANQTRQLAELLAGEGVSVVPVRVNAPYRPAWAGRVPVLRAAFRLIPYLVALWRAAGRCDVMHVMANSGLSWHLYAAPALAIGRCRSVPVVVNYRGGEAESFLARSHRSVRLTMAYAAALVVPSGFLQEVFARFGMTAEIVPNIVNLQRFNNPQTERATRRRLLVARNLEKIYGNDTAIRAFVLVKARYPDATLTIAGSGPEEEPLKRLASELGVRSSVVFTGRLDPTEMAELYRNVDVAMNPSLADNMPNSVLEALACGVPVVSTNVGGVPYIVRDEETALLVPPQSSEAMADAILRVIEDCDLCGRLVSNGLAEVQRYTWAFIWPLWAETYGRTRAQVAQSRN